MNCPVDQRPLGRIELESTLPAFECAACAGHWLRFGDYLAWRERQPEDLPELPAAVDPLETALAAPPAGPRWCPDCTYLLTRYHVGRGVAFTLDRCGNCNGVWLDRAEWETLRARGLHDNLHEMFGPGWQWAAREDQRRRMADAQFARQLGGADFARAQESGGWLAGHPRRSEILAYLQWQAR
jgi:Zn-finger nucleic acid-binding protein